jgi:hypothetical protein
MKKEPNVYAKCLDMLMEKKKNRMRFKRYYVEEDKKYILNLGVKVAKDTWHTIYKGVMSGSYYFLGPSTCPFCIVFGKGHFFEADCDKCVYAKIHGECDSEFGDDYSDISEDKKASLSNGWYKKVMIEIEHKFLEI